MLTLLTVKQEIGRLGILPYSEFWAKTTHHRTPAPALLLHWIFTVLFIIIAPLKVSNGFGVISTFYSYLHTYISSTFPGPLPHHLDPMISANFSSQSQLESPCYVLRGCPASSMQTVKNLVLNLKALDLVIGSWAL
jgi:Amino acid permease